MSKLTDLELCKKIAEIEGKIITPKFECDRFGHDCEKLWVAAKVWCKKQGSFVTEIVNFNPVEDWNITGPLQDKYKVDVWRHLGEFHTMIAFDQPNPDNIKRVKHEDLQRAICMAIVAKHEAGK